MRIIIVRILGDIVFARREIELASLEKRIHRTNHPEILIFFVYLS